MRIFLVSIVLSIALFVNGCGIVTYPKERLRDSIIKLCKDEYDLDVDISVFENTLAIYLPLTNLFDITLSLSNDAQDKIQDVLLGASRVTLSTDADMKFYCVITQD